MSSTHDAVAYIKECLNLGPDNKPLPLEICTECKRYYRRRIGGWKKCKECEPRPECGAGWLMVEGLSGSDEGS